MKIKFLLGFAVLFAVPAILPAQEQPVKLVLSQSSTVPSAGIIENLKSKCPNVTITLDSSKALYTLEAGATRYEGTINGYKFTLFNRDGDAVYGTSTVKLANAVKDVCNFIKTQK
jgi:hypothetical protein